MMNEKIRSIATGQPPEFRIAPPPAVRLSAVVRKNGGAVPDWDPSAAIVFFESMPALMCKAEEADLDIARVIVEGDNDAVEFLYLLASLPQTFTADVLWICESDRGFLSATGRGGDRILLALPPDQVRFYLEVNELVTEQLALRSDLSCRAIRLCRDHEVAVGGIEVARASRALLTEDDEVISVGITELLEE